jgi:two-component sensor histidine kinase
LAALNGRLIALSAAASAVSEADWEDSSIVELLDRVLAPHHDGHPEARFDFDGPDIPLPAGFASTLALALHELATNAGKYGALSVPTGKVSMIWDFDENRRFALTWTESGGPEVSPPSRSGFGTRMIERALFTAFDGHAALTYRPKGLQCRIVATIP